MTNNSSEKLPSQNQALLSEIDTLARYVEFPAQGKQLTQYHTSLADKLYSLRNLINENQINHDDAAMTLTDIANRIEKLRKIEELEDKKYDKLPMPNDWNTNPEAKRAWQLKIDGITTEENANQATIDRLKNELSASPNLVTSLKTSIRKLLGF